MIVVICSTVYCMPMKLRDLYPKQGKDGQVMLETVVVTASMLAMVAIMALLIYVFKEHGSRVLDLVASDYP